MWLNTAVALQRIADWPPSFSYFISSLGSKLKTEPQPFWQSWQVQCPLSCKNMRWVFWKCAGWWWFFCNCSLLFAPDQGLLVRAVVLDATRRSMSRSRGNDGHLSEKSNRFVKENMFFSQINSFFDLCNSQKRGLILKLLYIGFWTLCEAHHGDQFVLWLKKSSLLLWSTRCVKMLNFAVNSHHVQRCVCHRPWKLQTDIDPRCLDTSSQAPAASSLLGLSKYAALIAAIYGCNVWHISLQETSGSISSLQRKGYARRYLQQTQENNLQSSEHDWTLT